jgi:hypothetical protein
VHTVYMFAYRLWETPKVRHRKVLPRRPPDIDRGLVWYSEDDMSMLSRIKAT